MGSDDLQARLDRAIQSLPDPIDLGLPDLRRTAKYVHCVCGICGRPVGLVAITGEGPLFCGRCMNQHSRDQMMRNKAAGLPFSKAPFVGWALRPSRTLKRLVRRSGGLL